MSDDWGAGLFIADGGGNLVVNSGSHDNYDPRSSGGAGENADGFDLINAYSSVTIENSWAWRNGYLPQTTTAGNGSGFKAGGYGGKYVSGGAKHTVRQSVAFGNRAAGFYANHHTVANNYVNNTSYGNNPDFNMLSISSSGATIGAGTLRNNIAYTGKLLGNMTGTDATHNSWDSGVTLKDGLFRSVSTSGWNAARRADGALPVLPHLRPASGSPLIDKGVDTGLPFAGKAPDLGAFES